MHRDPFTHEGFYTETLFNRSSFTETLLRSFRHTRICAEQILHRDPFTQRPFTQSSLDTENSLHRAHFAREGCSGQTFYRCFACTGVKKCSHRDIHLSLCIPVSTHRCFADVFRGLLTPVLCCCFDTLACTSPYTPVSTLQMFSHSCIHQSIVVVFFTVAYSCLYTSVFVHLRCACKIYVCPCVEQ